MQIFRIDREKRKDQILSGKGAELFGGRWNYAGIPAVYCSQNRALAVLEILAHIDKNHWTPDRILATIEITDPSQILWMSPNDLKPGWDTFPYKQYSQAVFNTFAENSDKCILAVPSAIIPQEFNFILNPRNRNFEQLIIHSIERLSIDFRLIE